MAVARRAAVRRLVFLTALRAFYDEWTEVARVVIIRRDYLIRLGLAQRKVGKKGEDAESPAGSEAAGADAG